MNLKHHKFNKQLIKNITILQDLQDRDWGDMGIFSLIGLAILNLDRLFFFVRGQFVAEQNARYAH